LLEGLDARGITERTLFVVLGDHGEAFEQHPGNIGHSFFLYDENVHVPYFIAAPGMIEGPQRVGSALSVVDTAPTILDLLGVARARNLAVPAGLDGRSALDEAADAADLTLFLTDYAQSWLGLQDGCWKYLLELDAKRGELYEICADPGETVNRALSEADRAAAYEAHLVAWARAVRAAAAPGE
jgi:arylsulfatase A-like enzyme